MPDLFTAAADFLTEQLAAAGATRLVTLTDRESYPDVSIELQAAPGQSTWDEVASDGTVSQIAARDWLVDVTQLITDEGLQLPKRGWIITDSIDDVRYECVAAAGDAPWIWSDTGRRRIRIHTQSLDDDQDPDCECGA
ncbi:hypothetical protein [Allorhodopirellula heiligendammensis]|uniref:Phage head-tail joining protein domain-containing protein n=1 Tax=Allorhodopirellula heiligendammensis TaxID=2714739 RepID=A0A5C6C1I0_9BACT|nr:hypothetical protein [Allorhodopirellula heiligendammensis]TWU17992.1 hypothetical protein Poly21_01450 [Allorhodopirellula heiligendammensis]